MRQENGDFRRFRRSNLVLGLAWLGGFIGFLIPIAFFRDQLVQPGGAEWSVLGLLVNPMLLLAGIVCALLGAGMGLLLGALAGHFLDRSLGDPSMKSNAALSATRQIVGESCCLCGKRIASILEGNFCLGCGKPGHHQCKGKAKKGAACACCEPQ
jgi:hypothetical protein